VSAFRLDARLHATLRPVLQTASGNPHDGHRHAHGHLGSISSRSGRINDIRVAYASGWPVYAAPAAIRGSRLPLRRPRTVSSNPLPS
jgi:hypothetical protein